MHESVYDTVNLGNYTRDTIISASGTRVVDGGGFNYGAHVAAMMGLKAAAVTRLAQEDRHVVDALSRLGVAMFPYYTPASTHLRLDYPTSNVDERVITVLQTAGAFTPDQVRHLQAKAFIVSGSFRGEVNLDVMRELRAKKGLLAADVQTFVRIQAPDCTLQFHPWPEKQEVLSCLDILKTDAVEAEMLTGTAEMKVAARMLSDWGPREVVLTHRDGVLVLADGQFFEAPFCPVRLVGRSGRGDTCIAAYVAKRLTASAREAIQWAAAVTSLKLEAEGPIKRRVKEVEELISREYRTEREFSA